MSGQAWFERNGAPFAEYFEQFDLMVYSAWDATGKLLGFAMAKAEGRSQFVYELHVDKQRRQLGVGTALLDQIEKAGSAHAQSRKQLELNVHKDNTDAVDYYKRRGFVVTGALSGGTVLLMQRLR